MAGHDRRFAVRPAKVGHHKTIGTFRGRGGSLGLRDDATVRIIQSVDEGFPYEFIDHFQRSTQLPLDVIADVVRIPSRTLSRRKAEGRLQSDESERLLRFSIVFEKAVELFDGDRTAAMRWLQTTQPALHDHRPLEFVRTEIGAREVEDLIGRLEHGVFT